MNTVRTFATVVTLIALFIVTASSAEDLRLPDAERIMLDNGTVLILSEKHDVPLIGLRAIMQGGAVADPVDKNGLASLFASLLEKGAGDRSAFEFAEAIDSVGGSFSTRARLESISISTEFLSRDADLMVELLADALRRPKLANSELAKLRARMINFIRAAKDSDPGELLPIYGNAFLFGDHPYGNPIGGSESSLETIKHRDILEYYDEQIGGDRLIIAISGDFDAADMRVKLTEAFGDWRAATSDTAVVSIAGEQQGRRVLLIDKPAATQSYFWIANVGVAIDFEQRADLDLANTVFGGRFTSMLNTALRIDSGLTYGARSRLTRPSKPGSVAISSFTRSDATVEAVDMALGVLGQLRDSGVGADMIASARNYVLGQFPTDLETASQLAAQFAVLEAYSLGSGYINDYGTALADVTVGSIAAVIDDVYPSLDDLVLVFIGDAAAIRESLEKYGPVSEMSITEPRFRPL